MPRRLAALVWTLGLVVGCRAATATAVPSQSAVVPIAVEIASKDGKPVVDPDTLGRWAGRAGEEFAAFGIELDVTQVRYHHTNVKPGQVRRAARARGAAAPGPGLRVVIVDKIGRGSKAPRGQWDPRSG